MATATRSRVGRTMRMLHETASASPGLSEVALLRACGLPDRGLGYRRPAQRAAGAGLLLYRRARKGNAWRIYATACDAELDDLRYELMCGNPTAERAGEVIAVIDRLRAEQSVAYARASTQ